MSKIISVVNLNMVFQCDNRKFFTGGGFTGVRKMYFMESKTEKCHLGYDTPDLYIKPSLYMCRRVQGSQIRNKEAIWLYAELFLGHHDGSCHGLW